MQDNTITINVKLDEAKLPEAIEWSAAGSTANEVQVAKGMFLNFWDGADKQALRIDLWSKDMMIDEMTDFYFQTIMGMADTYKRATNNEELCADMKAFAKQFLQKFKEQQMKNK
jgi:gliding motility-associated protein GldC